MTYFSVNSERILAGNAAIQQTIERLSGEVSMLQSQLGGLADSWQGQAATSFQDLMQRWRITSDQVDEQLRQIGNALALAAQQYSDIEAANQRLFL